MARMDRLFGVTMAERGVSRLVSVALDEAVKILEPERGVRILRHSGIVRRTRPGSLRFRVRCSHRPGMTWR